MFNIDTYHAYKVVPIPELTFSSSFFPPLPFWFCQKVLAAHGAAKVSAYVTHGVFPKRSWERFTHKDGKYFVPIPPHLFC